jgi:hypothetical protein
MLATWLDHENVINMNDITKEGVKAGGNVDFEWTSAPREL